jgi:hypothetical protein
LLRRTYQNKSDDKNLKKMSMKKLMVTLVMMLAIGSVTAFAGDVNGKVLNAFKQDFSGANDVQWTAGDGYFKAAFIYNSLHIAAYYSTEGELYGITRHISSLDLPLHLLISLRKEYAQYWITDLFEVAKNNLTSYYITIEDADNTIMLKADEGTGWSVWKKTRKS